MIITVAKSYIESGNLTRGQFGKVPHPVPVKWINKHQMWVKDESVSLETALKNPKDYTWGCWDSDAGWMAPWPDDDITTYGLEEK